MASRRTAPRTRHFLVLLALVEFAWLGALGYLVYVLITRV
jgi:hypothetical protein